jgi:hypothetical protein
MIRAGRRATSASRTAQRPGRVGATDSRRSSSGTGMSGPCSCLRRPMLDFTRRGQRLHRLMATAVRCAATSPRRMAPGRCFSQSLQGLLQRKQAHHRPIGAPRTQAHVINPLSDMTHLAVHSLRGPLTFPDCIPDRLRPMSIMSAAPRTRSPSRRIFVVSSKPFFADSPGSAGIYSIRPARPRPKGSCASRDRARRR